MTQRLSASRALDVLWHTDLGRGTIQSIHWWPDRLSPSDALAAAARLRCLELRVDAAPRSSRDDAAYDEAEAVARRAAESLLDTGVLGVATRVIVSEPAPPSRLRSYRGLFYGARELLAGPRLQLEAPHGPRETILVGFEPVDAADGYPGFGGTLILHPPPRTEGYWRGLVPDLLAAFENERGFWQDDTKLVARLVQDGVAVLLSNYSPDLYRNVCLYYDRARDSAIRWAWEDARQDLSSDIH